MSSAIPQDADGHPAPGGSSAHPDGGGEAGGRSRLRITLLVVLVLALVVAGSVAGLVLYGQGSIERAEITGLPTIDRAPMVLPDGEDTEIMNILLIGSDDRDTLETDEVGTDRGIGRRPDTLMLAQLELNGRGAALLSFPRDLRVELCDGTTDKINASFEAGERTGVGAESCLVETITGRTGIEIHHYMELDFQGFLDVIDLLGGVTMYLDEPMIDSKAHLDVPAGCVTLTPEQALGFVRTRAYDDDFGRIARQQRFVRELAQEMTRIGVIANPTRLFPLVDAGARAVTTDDGFGLSAMREVAANARGLSVEDLRAHTVPGDHAMIGGVAYVVEREDEAEVLYASFRDASVLQPPPPEPEPTPEPVEVPPVDVLDASTAGGLADPAGELLEADDLEVGAVGEAEGITLPVTEVLHGPGLEDAAAQVAATFPDAVVRADDAVDGVQVVLGDDLDAAALEALLDEATAEPEPAAEPEERLPGETGRDFRGADPGDVDC